MYTGKGEDTNSYKLEGQKLKISGSNYNANSA